MEGDLDAPQTVEHPSDEQAPTESTDDLDPIDEFHRDDPIVDPAYIEYRDGYESLNVNLRLVPLTEVSMSNSDA